MGFYLRKSISVGPFRFNLSQHGVGVSGGVTGFRVGTGPRGNYVHMGRDGIYYRTTLPKHFVDRNTQLFPSAHRHSQNIPDGTHAPLENIESIEASLIVDSSSRELLEEIKVKQAKFRFLPTVVVLGVAILLLTWLNSFSAWSLGGMLVLFICLSYGAYLRDLLAKSVILFYEFDDEMERAYKILHTAAQSMAAAAAAWHIEAQGSVYNGKYHAGAKSLVRRKLTRIIQTSPPNLKTNIKTISIVVGKQTLHFFPDRVLIYATGTVGAVGYRELKINTTVTRFIEDGGLPNDATVIGHTWRFVNKDGGPDRRFSNNRKLPICLYDELSVTSSTGLNEVIQVSHQGTGDAFANCIHLLARTMPAELG